MSLTLDCLSENDPRGRYYSGRESKTKNGRFGARSCRPWMGKNFNPIGGKFHNFCRNPDNDIRGPWSGSCKTVEFIL